MTYIKLNESQVHRLDLVQRTLIDIETDILSINVHLHDSDSDTENNENFYQYVPRVPANVKKDDANDIIAQAMCTEAYIIMCLDLLLRMLNLYKSSYSSLCRWTKCCRNVLLRFRR